MDNKLDKPAEGQDRLEWRKERMSKAIILKLEGVSYEKISTSLGIPIDTVKSWFHGGNSKMFSTMQARAVVSCILSRPVPKALKIVEDEIDNLEGKAKFNAALRVLDMAGRIYAEVNKPEKEGQENKGRDIVLNQLNIFSQELSQKSIELAGKVLEKEKVEEGKIVVENENQ